jgi:hypothetical protein
MPYISEKWLVDEMGGVREIDLALAFAGFV